MKVLRFIGVIVACFCVANGFLLAGTQKQPVELRKIWFYYSTNLQVDNNVEVLETVWRRAAKAGYNGVLLADSKFGRLDNLGDMRQRYFNNIAKVKKLATELNLEIIPAIFPVGYSEGILCHDPNLAEGFPVKDARFVVRNGIAQVDANQAGILGGADFSDLKKWDWKDDGVKSAAGVLIMKDPPGNCRLSKKMQLQPFRQYHLSVQIRTKAFSGEPEVKCLAGNFALNHTRLNVKPTQDWTEYHVVFNSLDKGTAALFIGVWGGAKGTVEWKNLKCEEAPLVNLIRRDGAPLSITKENGERLQEGVDFDPVIDALMGNRPWKGSYDIYHEPPVIRTKLPDGSKLRVSFYHALTVYDGQVTACVSEPKTVEILKTQAVLMHEAWRAKGYFMSHDEIRTLNWCDACQKRKMDAGEIIADNLRTCVSILKAANPGGNIYVWSDMVDPNHNAHKDYYLVRGDLSGSWKGLDRDVTVVDWNYEKHDESLAWFSGRGHKIIISANCDGKPGVIKEWIEAGEKSGNVVGVVYTTWGNDYGALEMFIQTAREAVRGDGM